MLCTNVSQVLAVGVGVVAAIGTPLTVLQILYLNMLTDVFPALALGIGKGDDTVMKESPRPSDESILTRSHWRDISIWAVIIGSVVLSTLWIASKRLGLPDEAATTLSFLTLGFSKLWFVFTLRDPGTSFVHNSITHNPWIWGSMVLCSGLLVGAVYLPVVSGVLPAVPPTAQGWGLVLGMSLVPFVIGQVWVKVRSLASKK
jgi:Ca2+-transporting ATPase